jgi:hypothetical protein
VPDKCADVLLMDIPSEEDNFPLIVEFKGKCVPINSKSPLCKEDQIVSFIEDKVVPTCGRLDEQERFNNISNRSVLKTRSLSCRPGSRRDVTGKCRRTVTIKRPAEE